MEWHAWYYNMSIEKHTASLFLIEFIVRLNLDGRIGVWEGNNEYAEISSEKVLLPSKPKNSL